jgi:vitamin B12 transporter
MLRPLWLVPALTTVGLALPASAQVTREETIVVTGSVAPSEIGEVGRALFVIRREEIERLPVQGVADLLRLVPHLDQRGRGEHGAQTDFSLRGATFGQTLVMIDGVRMNDAQTGHHNGDIPVPLQDVDRVEVLYGPAAAQHGADAFGGAIHIITRRQRPRGSLHLTGGSFGFVDGSASARLGSGSRRAGITLGGTRSDGFTSDRDLQALEARGDLSLGAATRVTLGFVDKEMGARGFYGPAPSREWTSQALATLERGFSIDAGTAGTVTAFVRRHHDRFLYDLEHPDLSDNQHHSGAAGIGAKMYRQLGTRARLSVGSELGGDWIDSSVLGRESYGRLALFAELQQRFGGVTVSPGVRLTAYQGFGTDVSPSLAATGPLAGPLRWRVSAGHAFRVPTFTERFYRDPNHQANQQLEPEQAWGTDAGLDLASPSGVYGSLSVFARWDGSLIDWVRADPAERWTTANLRDTRSLGAELSLGRRFGKTADVTAHYAFLDTHPGELALQSKYVADFARHVAGLRAQLSLPFGLALGEQATFRRYANGRQGLRLGLRLSKRLADLFFYVEAENLLDSHTQELIGVDVPGRSFAAGLNARLP